jgi:predicted aminopeptidase
MSGDHVSLDSPQLAETTTPENMEKLRWVPKILEFCREQLGLDPGDSYQTYLDTGPEPVSFAVMASHPLALIPYQWHFPFVGSVPYKGYFQEEDARTEAARLEELGFNSMVAPVGAFSTLGWFQDPVLSTMLDGNIADLIDVIIHETTHRTLYFAGASSFNESLATHIAREGTVRLLSSDEKLLRELPAYLEKKKAQLQREILLLRLQKDLGALYRSPASDAEKTALKSEIFETTSAAYRHLVGSERAAFPASNAFVLSVARYHQYEPLLMRLQDTLGGNPADLMAYLKELPASEDPIKRIKEENGLESPAP